MKTILWITTAVFFLLSWWWYVCPHKQVCPFGQTVEQSVATSVEDSNSEVEAPANTPITEELKATEGRLLFNWSATEAVTGPGFDSYRDSILNTLGPTDILEITGLYSANEANNTTFENLGLARANQIRALFPNLPDDRIQLKSSLIDIPDSDIMEAPFKSASFRKVVNNSSVREIEGRMVIRFPHASDDMLENQALNEYLDELVAHLKTNDKRVRLVGHTDSSASAPHNLRLGQKRADAIKALLINKGIPADRIIAQTRGEEVPIASNDTEEGRQENRRVELTIIS